MTKDSDSERTAPRDAERTNWERVRFSVNRTRGALGNWWTAQPLWVQYLGSGSASLFSYLGLNWLYATVLSRHLDSVLDGVVGTSLPPYSHPLLVVVNYATLAVVAYLAVHLNRIGSE